MSEEQFDAIVIGGTTRGLVACHVLASLGYRAALVERAKHIGGVDRSFTAGGTTFDHGLHVLDEDRSPLATRLFRHVVQDAVHRVELRRGIALRGHVMPYAPRPADLPAELRALLSGDDLVDDLGDAAPTRARLASIYGAGFADLVCDEVLRSYPSEDRHRQLGVDESRLLTNLYPWFFPAALRAAVRGDASREFHDRLRAGLAQHVLYPRQGGFGGFVDGFLRGFAAGDRITVLAGAGDFAVEADPATHRVHRVRADGRTLVAPLYFWAASWPALCALLDLPCQEVATDRVLLGSFRFDRPPDTRYMEILVGDPGIRINRAYFPQCFRESDEPLLQVEFAHPVAEDWPDGEDAWRAAWLDGARRLGLIGAEHRVEHFDLRSFRMHFNSFGMEGEPLRDADPRVLREGSNLHPVVPSMANLNLNTHVPQAVAFVAAVAAGHAR